MIVNINDKISESLSIINILIQERKYNNVKY